MRSIIQVLAPEAEQEINIILNGLNASNPPCLHLYEYIYSEGAEHRDIFYLLGQYILFGEPKLELLLDQRQVRRAKEKAQELIKRSLEELYPL